MTARAFFLLALLAICAERATAEDAATIAGRRPNILFILTDDKY
jgi:hypothetical protein